MAGAVTHHEPAKTKSPGSEHHTPDISQSSSNGKGGRPPSPKLVVQDDTPDYAFTTDRIEENYPFFGTLLKLESGRYRLKETIKKSEAKNIEWVKKRYKGGDYQLRLKIDGEEKEIEFRVPPVEKVDEKQSGREKVIDQEFVTGLRKELKEEIRSDYQADIDRLQNRVDLLNDELEEKSRKLRDKTVDLAEADRKAIQTNREDTKELERKIDELKEEKRDLEFENFKLEQKIEYSDTEKNFSFVDMLKEAANNPDVVKMAAPIINNIFGGQNGAPQSMPALNGAQPANGQPRTNGQHHQNGQQAQHEADNQQESQQNESDEQKMGRIIQQFQTGVVQTVASSLANGEPAAEDLGKLVIGGVNDLKAQGIEELQPQMWINIAQRLIKFCLKNSITAQTAAEKIRPILEQVDGAKQKLKYIPASAAAEYLIGNYDINATEAQKEFLKKVLEVFKSELDQS